LTKRHQHHNLQLQPAVVNAAIYGDDLEQTTLPIVAAASTNSKNTAISGA
jgi:hypothetical protein